MALSEYTASSPPSGNNGFVLETKFKDFDSVGQDNRFDENVPSAPPLTGPFSRVCEKISISRVNLKPAGATSNGSTTEIESGMSKSTKLGKTEANKSEDYLRMEREQQLEWEEAQSIEINLDIVPAAKTHLKFLAAIDRNRWLYEGPGLEKAIYRYNACWLPLLAKHSECRLCQGPLVVPLDCEWVWHCHRLNPLRYKKDCEEFYGKILDIGNVVSSLEGTSKQTSEKIWNSLYPGEPYELDLVRNRERVSEKRCTQYDLIAAVKRQSRFFYQVSRPCMNEKRYIEGSVARYRGFLHLVKRNKEKAIKSFSVPTYDIDLIWHTHQLHPVSYCQDLFKIMGKILQHDDSVTDRSKGQKLNVGFSGTMATYEKMFGRRYRRAGAMYRGKIPSPVTATPFSGYITEKVPEDKRITLPNVQVLEVMLEFVGVRNLPEGLKGNLYVTFCTQPDSVFNAKRSLSIGKKRVDTFRCVSTGLLLFELVSSGLPLSKTMGTTFISLEDLLSQDLTMEKWFDLKPSSNIIQSEPIGLRVAISVTVPSAAPYVFDMVRSHSSPILSCLLPFAKSWTHVVDHGGNLVLTLQMSIGLENELAQKGFPRKSLVAGEVRHNRIKYLQISSCFYERDLKRQECRRRAVVGIMKCGETHTLAEFVESGWSMVDARWFLKTKNNEHTITGARTVRLFPGARLDYEASRPPSDCDKEITAVEFSADAPYGRSVALLDFNSSTVKVSEEWFVLPACVIAFILGGGL